MLHFVIYQSKRSPDSKPTTKVRVEPTKSSLKRTGEVQSGVTSESWLRSAKSGSGARSGALPMWSGGVKTWSGSEIRSAGAKSSGTRTNGCQTCREMRNVSTPSAAPIGTSGERRPNQA